jgi:hypothetical protein
MHLIARTCQPTDRVKKFWGAMIALSLATSVQIAFATSCPFDTPGTALTREGLVLSRYANGFTGNALVANSGFAATDAPAIQSNIVALTDQLDLNRNGSFDTTDATIISRKIAGFSNAAATAGIPAANLGPGGASAVNSFLLSSCVSNGYRITLPSGASSPVIIGGHAANEFGPLADGAIVAGGGRGTADCYEPSTGSNTRPCRNYVNEQFTTVSGGIANISTEAYSTVGGGAANTANQFMSTIAGGASNTASGVESSIGGGFGNVATGQASVVAGGSLNSATGAFSVVSGGTRNISSGPATGVSSGGSTVSGGSGNTASGSSSFVGGGGNNVASGELATVVGGALNTASGLLSFVGGGRQNTASGASSFALGNQANATSNNSFVWGGSSIDTNDSGPGTFTAYAPGGFYFFRGAPGAGGCTLPAGTVSWSCTSDRNTKTNITSLNARDILKRVANIPITRWSYKGTETVANIGPMAQDFWREFKLGDSDKSIASMNMSGVALAAIQGLNQKLSDEVMALRKQLAAKSAESAALRAELKSIQPELAAIKKKLGM